MFLELAGIYRFKPFACQTYWPRTKGKVERPFYYIEQHFIKGREFESFDQLCSEGEQFINEWEMEPNKTTLVAPSERFEEEKECLTSLPTITFSNQQKETRKVNWDCLLSFRGVKYSVPHHYAGEQVWVRSSRGNELLVYNERGEIIAKHMLSFQTGETIINQSHYHGISDELPKSLPKISELFIQTFSNGINYVGLLQKEVKANHLNRFRNILSLRNHYEDRSINVAIEQAVLFKRADMEFIPNILKSAARKNITVPVIEKLPTEQTETRPLSYYSHLLH
jgi:hypothetical protein